MKQIKKLIIILIFPTIVLGQKEKQRYTEYNMGVASVDDYDFSFTIPGLSFLFGETYSNNGLVTGWQAGLAFPTVATGKLFVGGGDLDKNIGIGIRPWPLFIGPQAKIGRLSFSFEVGTNSEASFDAGLIATIGYRWKIK